ncbi:MAG TPA: alpha/beta hydrolase [Candidatus Flavonifractor merdavium]|nr:alpha/beta hydrolase [Candidatus Flavonifractor merdavium]
MVTTQEFTFPSSDGVHSVSAIWWRPEGNPRGVVQLVHGISEHMGRYDPFARFLAEHGFAVVGHDHLGHGKTAKDASEYGWFGDQNGWKAVVKDVRALRQLAGEAYPGLPYFLMGHSMGSFVARGYLIFWPGTVDGAILSGTGQEPPLTVAAGRALSGLLTRISGPRAHSKLLDSLSVGAYNKQFKPNRTGADWISRDQAVVDAYCADPLCRFLPTVSMFHDMMVGLQLLAKRENLQKMDPDTPVYFFAGDKDPVGACGKGVRKVAGWFKEAGGKDVTVKLYPEGRHEMLNELNRDQVFQDVLAWLEGHMPAQ